VQCYIDYILVHSKTFEMHIQHLRQCFQRLRKHGLKLNLAKCDFGCVKVSYLGHILTPEGILLSANISEENQRIYWVDKLFLQSYQRLFGLVITFDFAHMQGVSGRRVHCHWLPEKHFWN
jgi:hypothetical protein